jgi:glyoxylase-like metal-dependent hydrolase (beta-lactamase superfamily II)
VIAAARIGHSQSHGHRLEEGILVIGERADVEGQLVVTLGQRRAVEQVGNPPVGIGQQVTDELRLARIGQAKQRNADIRRGLSAGQVEHVGADRRARIGHACMMTDAPTARTARFDLLLAGSLTADGGGVVSTCSLIRDGDRVVVVDPGMANRQADILEPLAAFGVTPDAVTDVVLSHHHPDHTINAGLFPNAAVHDHWAVYRGAQWEDSDAEGRVLSESVRLIRVPGHTPEDIATVVGTPDDVVVCTHAWWNASGPADDPYAPDARQLHASRSRLLAVADLIVPGHGAPFRPGPDTPR